MSTNFYVDFLYFIIYSIIGWICEVIFCSIPAKKFINRGFLNGPLCPVYGFGALIIIFFLAPFKDNLILLFIFGTISTTILEYITGYGMEKIFHSKWWDYSDNKFNINGRVCLLNSILFGFMAIILVHFLHIRVEAIIGSISYLWIQILSIFSIIILTVDMTITVQSVININEKLQKLRAVSNEIKERLDEKIDEKYTYLESRIHEALPIKLFERRIIHAFPDMKSIKFQEQLQGLKNEIEKRRNKKND